QAPEPLTLVALGVTCTGAEPLALDLHAHLRRGIQVLVPTRMIRRAALRRDDDRVVAVEAEDERRRRFVSALSARGREQEDLRSLAPRIPLRAVSLLIAAYVLLAEQRAHAESLSSVFEVKPSSA